MALFGAKPEAEGKTGKIGKLGKLVNRKNIIFLIVMHAVSFALIYLLCERFGEHELVLHGNVEIRQVELSFRVDGRIEKILVDEGMRVEKGELLARLESDIYKARLDAAKAAVVRMRPSKAALATSRLPRNSRPRTWRQRRCAPPWSTACACWQGIPKTCCARACQCA